MAAIHVISPSEFKQNQKKFKFFIQGNKSQ